MVIDRLHALLDDRAQLAVWISQRHSPHQINAGLAATPQLKHRIGNSLAPAIQRQTIRAVTPRIELSIHAITLNIDTEALAGRLLGESAAWDGGPQNTELVAITSPIALTRRGHEARIVLEGSISMRHTPDQALVDQNARAHHYLAQLTDGAGRNVSQVAQLCGVHRAAVGRNPPLAFLSPTITAAILAGKQSAHLTARKLARMVDMPLKWSEQAAMLGC